MLVAVDTHTNLPVTIMLVTITLVTIMLVTITLVTNMLVATHLRQSAQESERDLVKLRLSMPSTAPHAHTHRQPGEAPEEKEVEAAEEEDEEEEDEEEEEGVSVVLLLLFLDDRPPSGPSLPLPFKLLLQPLLLFRSTVVALLSPGTFPAIHGTFSAISSSDRERRTLAEEWCACAVLEGLLTVWLP